MRRVKAPFSKYIMHQLLDQDTLLSKALPETKRMTQQNFISLLQKHQSVILKPIIGYRGHGVKKISKVGDDQFDIHSGEQRHYIEGIEHTYLFLIRRMKKKHIVQQYIPLATIQNRPVDMRLIVQKRRPGTWHVTGKVAKIAGDGYFITNTVTTKGEVLPIAQALSQMSLNIPKRGMIESQLENSAVHIAKVLDKMFDRLCLIGLDMGVDAQGNIWIIEVNFNPGFSHFQKLNDKSMYKRIRAYQRMARRMDLKNIQV